MPDGLDSFEKFAVELATAGDDVQERAEPVFRKAGFDTVVAAQVIVHVITGYLKNSIGVDFDRDGLGFTAGPTARYGAYEELGTSYRPPHPYMAPAFESVVPGAVQALGQIGVLVLDE